MPECSEDSTRICWTKRNSLFGILIIMVLSQLVSLMPAYLNVASFSGFLFASLAIYQSSTSHQVAAFNHTIYHPLLYTLRSRINEMAPPGPSQVLLATGSGISDKKLSEKTAGVPADDTTDNGIQSEEGVDDHEDFAKGKSWRFWAIFPALMVTTLLSAAEVTVLSTAMPTIIRDLNIGKNYTWVVNAYLLTR